MILKQSPRLLILLSVLLVCFLTYGQTKNSNAEKWIKISDDEIVTISYNPDITTSKNGNHLVWVKAVYHAPEWQEYLANQIGSKQRIAMTRTRAEYDGIYSLVRVRQVLCYNQSGKLIFDTGDGTSAGWGYVNAGDPVGIVGEYICEKLEKAEIQKSFSQANSKYVQVPGLSKVEKIVAKHEIPDDDCIYDVVEENAQFPGGDEACFKWLSEHIKYPSICQKQGVQGRVIVQFVVNKDGTLVDVKTVRSPDPNLSMEVERVVKEMPKWKPARQGNKIVRSRFNLPVMMRFD